MRKTMLTTLLALAALIAFAVSGPLASGASSKSVRVTTRTVSGLGSILVDGQGRTLYMFVPDKHKRVTCFKACAKIWPPLFTKGRKAVAAGHAKKALLGTDPDKAGGPVVTYNGWPLYLYLGDRKPGEAFGQALKANGGLWYVMSPSGAIIKHKAKKGGSGGGGGGGGSTTTTTSTTTSTTTTSTSTAPAKCTDADNDGDQDAGGPDDGDGCL